jgi:MerR family transcriptional regulator, mercuric resistance operon regulatory protein
VADKTNGKGFLRPGEVARLAGVSTDTLRHYERKGLIARPRRSSNRYREHPPATVDRVRLVQRALGVGFTLDELAKIFKQRDRGEAPCRQVRALAEAKLADIEKHLEELIAMRGELRSILQDWDARLARTSAGGRAGLLESLAGAEGKKGRMTFRARAGVKRSESRKENR